MPAAPAGWHRTFRIDRTEKQYGKSWDVSMPRFIADPRDTATPDGTVQLFKRLYGGELLSSVSSKRCFASHDHRSRPHQGLLPPGLVVARAGTGTTGTRDSFLNGARPTTRRRCDHSPQRQGPASLGRLSEG